jgi:hypothetical protein
MVALVDVREVAELVIAQVRDGCQEAMRARLERQRLEAGLQGIAVGRRNRPEEDLGAVVELDGQRCAMGDER